MSDSERLRLRTASPGDLSFGQHIQVRKGLYYRFTARVRTEEVTGDVGANLSVFGTPAHSAKDLTGTMSWTIVEQVFRAGSDGEYLFAARLGQHGRLSTGMAWFDSMRVEELDQWPGAYQILEPRPPSEPRKSTSLRRVGFFIILPFVVALAVALRCGWMQSAPVNFERVNPLQWQVLAALAVALLTRLVMLPEPGIIVAVEGYRQWALALATGGLTQAYEAHPDVNMLPGMLTVLWLLGELARWGNWETVSTFAVLFKLPFVALECMAVYILLRHAKRRQSPQVYWLAAALVALNPALLLQTAFLAQPDALLAVFVFFSFLAAAYGRFILAGLAAGVAMVAQPHGMLFGAWMVWLVLILRGPRDGLRSGCALLAVVAVFALPFLWISPYASWSAMASHWLESFTEFSRNGFNIWTVLGLNREEMLAGGAWVVVQFTALAWLAIAVLPLLGKRRFDRSRVMQWGLVFCLGAFLWVPGIHEGSLLPAVYAAAWLMVHTQRFRWVYAAVAVAALVNVGYVGFYFAYLQIQPPQRPLLAPIVAILALGSFAAALWCALRPSAGFPAPWLWNRIYGWIARIDAERVPPEVPRVQWFDLMAALMILILSTSLVFYDIGLDAFPDSGIRVGDHPSTYELWWTEPVTVATFGFYAGRESGAGIRVEANTDGSWRQLSRRHGGEVRYRGDPERGSYKMLERSLAEPVTLQRAKVHVSGNGGAINELVFFDRDNQPLTPERVTAAGESLHAVDHPLFDEQSEVTRSRRNVTNIYWDEIFYATSAYDFVHKQPPAEKTHPPLGKSVIALGIRAFGMTPKGWRFTSGALAALFPLVLFVGGWWLTGSRLGAYLSGFIGTFEPLLFIHGRWANIDILLLWGLTVSFLALYRWYRLTEGDFTRGGWHWFVLASVAFATAAATKWSALFTGFALFVLVCCWFAGQACRCGPRQAEKVKIMAAVACWGGGFVLVPAWVYYISHWEFLAVTANASPFSGSGWNAFWSQQAYVLAYHAGKESLHVGSSHFFSWPFMWQPISILVGGVEEGRRASVNMLGNPVIWWAGCAVMALVLWVAARGRNLVLTFVGAVYFLQAMPWMLVERTTFLYHYLPFIPLVIWMIAYFLVRFPGDRWVRGGTIALFCAAVVGVFALFYPAIVGMDVPSDYFRWLVWFDRWEVL